MKYKHKFLQPHAYGEGPQLDNIFHFYGDRKIDGELYVGLIQEGQKDPSPTWFRDTTFRDMFEPIP